MVDISAEELIPLVKQRPVIWDKSSDNFKDKALKTAAWREICCAFKPDFDKLEENEMKEFAKSVNIKWVYIRDAFLRSQKKQMRTGSVKKPKPYVYTNLLSFLNVNESGTRQESESQSNYTDSSSDEDAVPEQRFQPRQPPPVKKMRIENVRTVDDKITPFFNSRLSDQDEQTEHPHISFMKGVLPSLATFDDDENLEFQAGVVELIQKIRRKRHVHDAYPYDIKMFETSDP